MTKSFGTLFISILTAAIVGAASCSSSSASSSATGAESAADTVELLPSPRVPSALGTTEARAAYVLEHFWDELDFNDTARSLDTAFVEQNFVNFTVLFPYADSAAIATGVDRLITRSAQAGEPGKLVRHVAELYLDDPNSPVRSEEAYIHFLRNYIANDLISPEEKIRPRRQLQEALKNRPGMAAADFAFELSDGSRHTLAKYADEQLAPTVVLFYDPDCETCAATITDLNQSEEMQGVSVLAMDVMGNREAWKSSLDHLPPMWNVGFATEPIEEMGLYTFPALPAIYVVDYDGRVLLKDCSLEQLYGWLSGNLR